MAISRNNQQVSVTRGQKFSGTIQEIPGLLGSLHLVFTWSALIILAGASQICLLLSIECLQPKKEGKNCFI